MQTLRFISSNPYKIEEAKEILGQFGIDFIAVNLRIAEIQTDDIQSIAKDKALRAFDQIGRPLFVEHTGLFLAHINDLPGGLTQLFWDRLQAERFSQIFGTTTDTCVVARTVVAYCDAQRLYYFRGEIRGNITPEPRGPRDFQWDCVFVPAGFSQTFAEMGKKKSEISMRRIALDAFAKFLKRKLCR